MILHILIILFLLYLGVAILINGLLMVISPKAWFRLPRGLKASGGLSARRYSSGWGAIEVRLGGAVVLGTVAYVLYHMFITNHEEALPQMHNALHWIAPLFMWVVIIGLAANALFMLISPITWFHLPSWIRGRPGVGERVLQQNWGIIFMRFSGALFLLIAILFAYVYFSNPR